MTAALVGVAIVGLVLFSSPTTPPVRYATPEACLDAFRDANLDVDVEAYLACLDGSLRSRWPDRGQLEKTLRRERGSLKAWTRKGEPEQEGTEATALVEKVRSSGISEVRFRLRRSSTGWRIVEIEEGRESSAGVRYGTRVGEER